MSVIPRPLLARVLVLIVAIVPAVWGICPCWVIAGPDACAASDGHVPAPHCPCCPAPATPGGAPHPREWDGCPVISVRHTLVGAPAAVSLPSFDGVAVGLVVDVPTPVAAPTLVRAAPRVDPSGGAPPPLVGTVVLVV